VVGAMVAKKEPISLKAKYFTIDEFRCPCCGKVVIQPLLIELLDAARLRAGIPFYITSGYRCPKHNREVGGHPKSMHCYGAAADIHVANSVERYRILEALLRVGFRRIGIYSTWIHADVGDYIGKAPTEVIWYGSEHGQMEK